jgi:acetyl-CoA carboxylase carboxyltransferase component
MGLEELRRRKALTTDEARPDAAAKRHAAGARTVREHLADLFDPGTFVELGALATAAQERTLHAEDLRRRTPADGVVTGYGLVAGRPTAFLGYDPTVLAGTQGIRGHHKSDRLLELARRHRMPVVLFAEGGGGRPTDTDLPVVSALDVRTFEAWAALAGTAPRVAVVHGRCFAGNAVLAACADVLIATENATLGVAGPAMLAGAGLGDHAAADIGPAADLAQAGVVDVLVPDEAAGTGVAKQLLGVLSGATVPGTGGDQTVLRTALPENPRAAFDVRPVLTTLADTGSLVELRAAHAPELVTAVARIDGRPVGLIANQTLHMAGAITAPAGAKGAWFLELCDRNALPVVSLVDTPGIMGGPQAEREGVLRQASRLLLAGAALRVPVVGVVLRRGYGLGAQAMLMGSTKAPTLTVAWPDAHLGPMGLEGAVRLAAREELAALPDEAARTARVRELAAAYRDRVSALEVARVFEIDDVIDPADTRSVIAAVLAAAG